MQTRESRQHLYMELKQTLADYNQGSRFLSVREILDRFSCNRRTLDPVLQQLEKDRLITRVPRSGIFSNMPRKTQAWRVLLAIPSWPSDLWQQWSHCAQQYVQSHSQWHLQTSVFELHRSSLTQLRKQDCDAMIVLHASELLTKEELQCLVSIEIPIVMLNVNTSSVRISCVGSTDDLAGQQACQYLVAHGHRNLAIIQSEPLLPSIECRIRNFKLMADFLGATVELIDCNTAAGEYARQRANQGILEYLDRHRGNIPFTAAYVISGESASGALAALRQGGYDIPEDISIIAHASTSEGEFLHPPLTLVGIDLQEEVARAFTGLEECLLGKRQFFHAMAPTRIVERSSVKTLNLPS